jgi:RNA polymerase sigma-70 factor (ECF subfamily)
MLALASFLFASPDSPRDGLVFAVPQLLGMSEAEAIGQLRAGDERVYERIYRVFQPRLVAVASQYTPVSVAEEIAQDVLTLLWERRDAWPESRGITTYLYASARNRARDYVRHQGVVGRVAAASVAENDVPGTGTMGTSPQATLEREEFGRAFVREVNRLPDGAKTAFTLRWVHGLSYSEIAAVMGAGEPAVRKQVSRARETLLIALQRYVEG